MPNPILSSLILPVKDQTTGTVTNVEYDLPASGSSITVDDEISSTSTHPVQNKVISEALDEKANTEDLGTAATRDVPTSGNANVTQVVIGSDTRLTNARPASDVSDWAKADTKPTYIAAEVGAIPTTQKGANSGVAELDENGKVPSSQLPSYVDDVLEYESVDDLPLLGETGKIYVVLDTNKTYRWSGSAYVVVSQSLALGETSSTAYRGDRGKTAYDHSQTTSGNPHNVTKSDVGLGDVGNFKAVSTVASQGLSDTEKSNARANIGAGTSSFSGSYNDLTNKPTIPTVNNATLTIQKNGTNVQTFTANQSSNATANITVPTKVSELTNDSGYTTNTGTVTQVKVGTTAYNPSSGVISLPAYPTDTNTHRPIQVNGTEVLGNNTTALNLKAGSNVSLSNSSGTVTIAATNTTYGVVSTSANGLAPKVTDTSKYLKGDGTWNTPTNTDTKNTAGSTDTSSKIFLIGATSQAANPQTYSHDTAYVGTDGCLYSGGSKVLTAHDGNNRRGFYGTCATAAGTAEKAVTLSSTAGWELVAGTIVGVKFTNTNTAGKAKLNVNSSGAKQIWYNGAAYTGTEARITGWAGHVIYYMYDGTYWCFFNNDQNYINTNTTYSAGSNITLSGTTFSLTKANVTGALGYTPPTSDTNTHRPIQVNGTEILGNNTTALNLKAGSNVSLSNSSGTVTIAATNTTYGVVSTSANGLAPKVTDTSKFLKGDGTWATPTNTTYSAMSSSELTTGTATTLRTVRADYLKSGINTLISPTSTKVSDSSDAYSASKAYRVGDYVIYNNTLYKCKTNCSAAAWSTNSSCFVKDTLTSAVNKKFEIVDLGIKATRSAVGSWVNTSTFSSSLIADSDFVYLWVHSSDTLHPNTGGASLIVPKIMIGYASYPTVLAGGAGNADSILVAWTDATYTKLGFYVGSNFNLAGFNVFEVKLVRLNN